MKVAMSTAVPNFASNEEARAWFVERLAAERALAQEMAEFQRYMQANRGRYPNVEDFKLQLKKDFDEDEATAERRRIRNAGVEPQDIELTPEEQAIVDSL